jgi:hypothetical protein
MGLASYEGNQDLALAKDFLKKFIEENRALIPITCVIDLEYIYGRGWCIIELNATWGAGLNGCEANQVVSCLAFSTTKPI